MLTSRDLENKGVKIVRVRGHEVLAHCPFHDDANPSFVANLKKGVFYCFGCGAKGTFRRLGLSLEREVYTDSFSELLSDLLGNNDEDISKVFSLPREYQKLTYESGVFWNYVMDRGISPEVTEEYQLGYCCSGEYADRIIVPLGTGFIARSIYEGRMAWMMYGNKHRKYLYPLGFPKSKLLFNYNKDDETLLVVEGIFDVLKLATYGIKAACVFGCLLSDDQYKVLYTSSAQELLLCFDSDEAGYNGMEVAVANLTPYFGNVYKLLLPSGKDPCSCSKAEINKALAMKSDMCDIIPSYIMLH